MAADRSSEHIDWKHHFERMAQGETDGKTRSFYMLKKKQTKPRNTDADPKLSLLSQTQAQVNQAKVEAKRILNEDDHTQKERKKRKTLIIRKDGLEPL